MKKDNSKLILGAILILAGVMFLLQEFQILGSAIELFWVILMAAGSGVFLWVFFTKKEQWWAVIPGLTLLGLTLAGLDAILDVFPDSNWGGGLFLGCIGLAFWLVYIRKQEHWWAIIPGGVMITLGFVAGFASRSEWNDVLFFLGLGATFALVAVLPDKIHNTKWAYIPAGILAVLGLALLAPVLSVLNIVWPIIIIGLGVYLLIRGRK